MFIFFHFSGAVKTLAFWWCVQNILGCNDPLFMSTDNSKTKTLKKPFILILQTSVIETLLQKKDPSSILKVEGQEIMKFEKSSIALLYLFCTYYLFNIQYEFSRKKTCIFMEKMVFKWNETKSRDIPDEVTALMKHLE